LRLSPLCGSWRQFVTLEGSPLRSSSPSISEGLVAAMANTILCCTTHHIQPSCRSILYDSRFTYIAKVRASCFEYHTVSAARGEVRFILPVYTILTTLKRRCEAHSSTIRGVRSLASPAKLLGGMRMCVPTCLKFFSLKKVFGYKEHYSILKGRSWRSWYLS